MSDFKRIEAGHYVWNIGYGFKAQVLKDDNVLGGWVYFITNKTGNMVAKGSGFGLKQTERQAHLSASKVEIEQVNMMSKETFMMAITTPWSCNPAGETYWCM